MTMAFILRNYFELFEIEELTVCKEASHDMRANSETLQRKIYVLGQRQNIFLSLFFKKKKGCLCVIR